MVRLRREVRSRMDCILGIDRCLFRNVAIQDPRHNSDHYMVLGRHCIYPLREHTKYLGWRMYISLRPPTIPTREDGLSVALRRDITKPKAC